MSPDAQVLKSAVELHRAGHVRQAARSYREILRFNPAHADALHLLGVACHQQGEHAAAVDFISRAVAQNPTSPAYHSNLGAACRGAGRLHDALHAFREALRLDPIYGDALFNLANCYRALKDDENAADCYGRFLERHPGSVDALIALASVRQSQGRAVDAIHCLERVVQLAPNHVEARHDLGCLLKSEGRLDAAANAFRQLIACRPEFARAHHGLANVHKQLRNYDESRENYDAALRLDPGDADTHSNFASLLLEMGEASQAASRQQRAMALDPSPARRIWNALLLPPLYRSASEMSDWRERLETEVDRLILAGVTLDPSREPVTPNFYLAYQAQNDRNLQQKIGRLYRSTFDRRNVESIEARRDNRIRVGFVSHYFKEHTIGRLMQGAIGRLSRERFHVSVFAHNPGDDELARRIRRQADEYIALPRSLPRACTEIARRGIDILLYTDLGMDPFTTSLAHSRLARVQATTWGHPVTSGLSSIDYFLSSELYEPEGAAEHYCERLALSRSLCTCYERPQSSTRQPTRAHFDLPDDKTLYACPQSLFKLHPEFDSLLGEVLRRDGRGTLLLLSGHCPRWNELVLDRMRTSMPDVVDRVRFLPRMGYDDFLGLQRVVDVLLDPPHFSGGNTSFEALAFGTPVVTTPSPFLRGRLTYGLYRKMGVFESVARDRADYVDVAVRLGTDESWRRHVRERIVAANECLFEDAQSVRDLEKFFERAMSEDLSDTQDNRTRTSKKASWLSEVSPAASADSKTLPPALSGSTVFDPEAQTRRELAEVQREREKYNSLRASSSSDPADRFCELGRTYEQQGMLHKASICFQRALATQPMHANALVSCGNVLKVQDEMHGARAVYRKLLRGNAKSAAMELWLAALCPAVFDSVEAVDQYRHDLAKQLRTMADEGLRLEWADIAAMGSPAPYNLQFHGRDDRPLKEAFAALVGSGAPRAPDSRRAGPPRVGFVVTAGHEGAFLRFLGDAIVGLRCARFERVIVCPQQSTAKLAREIDPNAVQFLEFPDRFEDAIEVIGDARFDVLYHWEVGSDVFNYFLPFYRLAPVQCTSAGLPVTSGIRAMNYFLSDDFAEPDDADCQYSESLIRARSLLSCQQRMVLPAGFKTRSELGFSSADHLYVCAQKIEKFHPDFDRPMAEILRSDSTGKIVIPRDKGGCRARKLQRRLAATCPDVVDRFAFVPRLELDDYLSLLHAADVILDPLHYGSGLTAYDAFSLNKPVVTLPGAFVRARYTHGMYRRMGLAECTAATTDEYVSIAVSLGADVTRRRYICERIAEASAVLFNDRQSIWDYESIFDRLVHQARQSADAD